MVEEKKMNIKLVIEYDGTNYRGWQRIPGKITIQGALEEKISQILNENVKITGASRTDAGVHALGQTANFKTNRVIDPQKLESSLNKMLPKDIVIKRISRVPERFNARHSAKLKIYRYVIRNSKTPVVFERNVTLFFRNKLDLPAMRKASKFLEGTHDFKCFSAREERTKTIRTVKKVKIKKSGSYIFIEFKARSFLRRMIRVMVGFLLGIGTKKFKPEDIRRAFKGKLKFSPLAAPAHGLFLKEVKY